MIDFRYHLISIVAVILALSLGIVVGSGFLGGPLLERLERQVKGLEADNNQQQSEITALDKRAEQAEEFARSATGYLTDSALRDEKFVLFQFDGTDGDLIDGLRRALTEAGGRIASEIILSQKFALSSQPTRDELSLIVDSIEAEPEQLRLEAGAALGERSADAAVVSGQNDAPSGASSERLVSLLEGLERAEFVGTVTNGDEVPVPGGATFVVIGGSDGRAPFEVGGMTVALAEALTERGAPAMVIESETSTWGLVAAVRGDVETRSLASTVDNGDTTMGRIAAILGLRDAQNGAVGHFGFRAGRTAVIPAPSPES